MTLRDDVRALGVGAPLRAMYEISKRTVGHSIVFGSVIQSGHPPTSIRLLPQPQIVSDVVRARTLQHADRIVAGQVEIFGRAVDVGDSPDWSAVIHNEASWPSIDWWKIDIRSDDRVGDVKWCWELARFRHVIILARACWLEPDVAAYQTCLRDHVSSFLDQNPAEKGVHWYSNLEIALRAFAWLQVLSLAERSLGPDLVAQAVDTMYRSGRHLVADLPYTVSTMRNNHLLGDAVGLSALGYAFGDHAFGRRWTRIGDRLITRFLASAVRPRGTFIEDSVSYHRFVVELLSARIVLGGAPATVRTTLREAAQFLCRLGVLEGKVPQYGDWDEGRALATSTDPQGLAGSALAGLALAGTGADPDWFDAHDEVAWYCALGQSAPPEPAERDGRDIGGGVARAVVGEFTLWIKSPAGHSHNHADATAIALLRGSDWLIGDPGTGTYNGPIEQRNYFRSSRSHNVLRVGGEDQLGPHRAFRWKHAARGAFLEPIELGSAIVLGCWHDAYTRLEPPSRVIRLVVLSSHGARVADFVESPRDCEFSLAFAPGATVGADGSATISGAKYSITLPGPSTCRVGVDTPFVGWWSPTYGQSVPAPILDVVTPPSMVSTWSIGDCRQVMDADGSAAQLDIGRLSVEWRELRAVITLTEADGRTWTRTVQT